MEVSIVIPNNVDFRDLKLNRSESGISFDWKPIEAICGASGLSIDLLKNSDEGNVAGLIIQWYAAHLQHGGEPDLIADDLINEVIIEDMAGSSSHLPPTRLL